MNIDMIKPGRNRWYIERQLIHNRLALFHIIEGRDGNPSQLVTFTAKATPMDPATMVDSIEGPAWAWTPDEAQQIMDQLWLAGIRPQDGRGSGAQVEALQDHLGDLRTLLWKASGIPSPEK